MRKLLFGGLWLALAAYAFLFAPPNQPDTFELIQKLSTGQWQGINPLVIALFNIMGVWPMIYACLLLLDGRGQKIPAGLFVAGSFGVGAFALLPYLALRQPNPSFVGEKNALLKVLHFTLRRFTVFAQGFYSCHSPSTMPLRDTNALLVKEVFGVSKAIAEDH